MAYLPWARTGRKAHIAKSTWYVEVALVRALDKIKPPNAPGSLRRDERMAKSKFFKTAVASPTLQWIFSGIGAAYLLLVRWTGRADCPPPPPGGPYIIAMWHGRLAQLPCLRAGHAPLVALISG